MALDTQKVGANDREIKLLGDPSAAGNLQSVIAVADARSLAGLFAALTQNVGLLLNAGGTYDQLRSAIGTVGILVVNVEGTKTTYSCAGLGFTPVATATDFLMLVGSATKVVRLLYLKITGVASAGASVDIQLIKRLTANAGGTVAAPTIAQNDSNDAPPTALVNTYSVNPVTPGNNGGSMRAAKLNLGVVGSGGTVEWRFGDKNDKAGVLRGVAQALAVNWNGAAVPGGTSLAWEMTFSEE